MTSIVEKSGNFVQLGEADVGTYVRLVEPGNVIVQVDDYGSSPGDVIQVEYVGNMTAAFDLATGATLRIMPRFTCEFLDIYGVVHLRCVSPDEWVLTGALKPKAQWQLDLDSYPNLSYGLHPAVDVDWEAALAELEATLAEVNSPGLPVISCTVTYP